MLGFPHSSAQVCWSAHIERPQINLRAIKQHRLKPVLLLRHRNIEARLIAERACIAEEKV
jgi:hypothetical protein